MKHYDSTHFEIPEYNAFDRVLTGVVSALVFEALALLAIVAVWYGAWVMLP